MLLLPLLAVGVAAALAACGSASPSSSGSSGTGSALTASRVHDDALKFAQCMRANGVPNFPDLGNNGMRIEGGGQTISINGVSVDAPAYRAARQKCQKYLPHTQGSPAQAAQQQQRGVKFARCMRSHGVPNFPDPKVVSSHSGNQQVYLPGINPQSPAFQTAAKACGGGPKGP
jgi:hypothetical protein